VTAPTRRRAPAFKIFASDDLANPLWFPLSIAERGMVDSIRRALWVAPDGRIPRDPDALAVLIRCKASDVKRHLTRRVIDHFERCDDAQFLFDPELNRQREEAADFHAARAKGADKTNEKRRALSEAPSVTLSGALSVPLSGALAPEMQRHDVNGKATTGSLEEYLHEEESAGARFPPLSLSEADAGE
jgi:hypothetical protein